MRRGGWILAAALLSTCLFAQELRRPQTRARAGPARRPPLQPACTRSGPASPRATRAWGCARTESGTLLLLKPGRMKWEYSAPAGKLFLLDGKYAWFYSRGDSQVQRIPAKELDDLRSPLRFLLGHTELEKELNAPALAPAADGQFTLTGQPKGQEKRVARLTLTVTADGAITAHRDRRGRRRAHPFHLHRRAAQRAGLRRDLPLHAAPRRAGGGRAAAGVRDE